MCGSVNSYVPLPRMFGDKDRTAERLGIVSDSGTVDCTSGRAANNREWIRRAPRQHCCDGAQNPDLIGGSGAAPAQDHPDREPRFCRQCFRYLHWSLGFDAKCPSPQMLQLYIAPLHRESVDSL
jgi:hypothetical protein